MIAGIIFLVLGFVNIFFNKQMVQLDLKLQNENLQPTEYKKMQIQHYFIGGFFLLGGLWVLFG